MSTVVLEPTVRGLEEERDRILRERGLSKPDLARRAAAYLLTPEEAAAYRRLREIHRLLGE